jgi:hypothetical protein
MVLRGKDMKVHIGKYPGPIQCKIFTKHMDERYGFIKWPEEYSRYEKFLEKLEDSIQWILNNTVNRFRGYKQYEYIRIDPWDTWSMDHTLAPIILPMLRQLVDTRRGAHYVENEDRPEHLRAEKPTDYGIDEFHSQAWDWVMDEMIYAFDCKANKDDVSMRFESREEMEVEQARISNGFRLFGKYYEALWD